MRGQGIGKADEGLDLVQRSEVGDDGDTRERRGETTVSGGEGRQRNRSRGDSHRAAREDGTSAPLPRVSFSLSFRGPTATARFLEPRSHAGKRRVVSQFPTETGQMSGNK